MTRTGAQYEQHHASLVGGIWPEYTLRRAVLCMHYLLQLDHSTHSCSAYTDTDTSLTTNMHKIAPISE